MFVEYDSRHARRALDHLLDETHELYGGKMLLDQGECIYLRGTWRTSTKPPRCLASCLLRRFAGPASGS